MKINKVIAGSDHSGYLLKDTIIKHLAKKLVAVQDVGTFNQEMVDYPDYAAKVVEIVLEQPDSLGILICATGIGMAIAANRNLGVRAAPVVNLFMAERARSHNDANILVLGAKVVDEKLALDIVDKFLATQFEGGRHIARLAKLG